MRVIAPPSVSGGPSPRMERRRAWQETRSAIESDVYKHRRGGGKRRRHWSLFTLLMRVFGMFLKAAHLYQKGYRNATDITVREIDLDFVGLPEAFDGYSLLHLTDLHLDFIPGYDEAIRHRLRTLTCDACVLTGDYRARITGGYRRILGPMERIVGAIRASDGILATLGNHDTYRMVRPFERMGITVLANESTAIERNGSRIQLTGIDDPYYYYTDQSLEALERSGNGFKIALVHSPSLFDTAADNGFNLYLCGHTHGGQICLPGGRPVILHLRHGRRYFRGLWRYRGMIGYTSQGCGTVGLPIRFNTRSEITRITLRRGRP